MLTDSGGIQEEAPGLGKPVLVMRDTTERPEALEAGTVKLVGTDFERIVGEAAMLPEDNAYIEKMSKAAKPYGDGKPCEEIVEFMDKRLGMKKYLVKLRNNVNENSSHTRFLC